MPVCKTVICDRVQEEGYTSLSWSLFTPIIIIKVAPGGIGGKLLDWKLKAFDTT